MKWAITADLQFNTQPRYSMLTPHGITSRLRDTVDCLRWVVNTAQTIGCERLLCVGDIFDSRTAIDVSVLDQARRAFNEAGNIIETHLVVGNHDCYLRSPRINSLQVLASPPDVIVHEKPTQEGPFYFVPWTDDRDEFQAWLRKAGKSDALYLATHAMFEGAVPKAKGLPLSWLMDAGWHGVFMGDVHDPVVLHASDPLIRYAGAPLQIHFGDAGGERGFLVLDDETGEVEFIENDVSPRFHLVTSHDEMPEVATERDFIRVRTDDPDLAESLAKVAKGLSSWVEVEAPVEESVKVRLDVRATMDDRALLEAYAKHCDVSSEQLVDAGLALLHEARAL